MTETFDFKAVLRDTALAGLLALLVFGPIVGIVLDGYDFNLQPQRVALLVAIVMAGRFLLSAFGQTARGRKWFAVFRRNVGSAEEGACALLDAQPDTADTGGTVAAEQEPAE